LRVVLRTVKRDLSEKVLSSGSPLHASLFEFWINDWKARTSGKDKRVDGISGSVDSLVFYEQLKRFGVVAPTENDRPPSHLTDRALQKVKNKRNELAHGEKSFTDLGRDLAVEDLESDSSSVFGNLKKIANEVDKYLRDRRYLAPPPTTAVAPAAADTEA
ncbi:MAG: MAE_28990/MAE_18760 family HEPN-like nuclease, partial [Hydrogenophaga sp.]|nr:MAE_28990/MAE_18760 family HEPN-like nuclease [Hydrogenophaga sp.]